MLLSGHYPVQKPGESGPATASLKQPETINLPSMATRSFAAIGLTRTPVTTSGPVPRFGKQISPVFKKAIRQPTLGIIAHTFMTV
jgi:hypothetical protein